jgi:hypothetical protein
MRSQIFGFKFLMTLFNYALDNSLLFGVAFAGTVGFIGYKFASSYLNSFYVDKSIQTDAWENYSDRSSQMAPESITSIDTVTPISKNISPVTTLQTISEIGTQTISEGASTVTTVLPIPPINIEMVPNPEMVNIGTVVVENTRAIDYFSHVTWIQQSVDAMIARADLVNNSAMANADFLTKADLITNLF